MKIIACIACLLAATPALAQSAAGVSEVWVADQGNGTYKTRCCMRIF